MSRGVQAGVRYVVCGLLLTGCALLTEESPLAAVVMAYLIGFLWRGER